MSFYKRFDKICLVVFLIVTVTGIILFLKHLFILLRVADKQSAALFNKFYLNINFQTNYFIIHNYNIKSIKLVRKLNINFI